MEVIKNDIRNWVIYKITNPTGMIYVGLTRNFIKRMYDYSWRHGGKGQPIIYNSIIKYGFKNHKVEKIDSFTSELEYANGREMFWIRSFMSNKNKWPEQNGMNLCDGGGIVSAYNLSEKSRRRMLESCKGRPSPQKGIPRSEEVKRQISLAKTGKPNANKGRKLNKFSEKTKERMRVAGVKRAGRCVLIYNLANEFIKEVESLNAANRETGMTITAIKDICTGRSGSPRKFIFKFK